MPVKLDLAASATDSTTRHTLRNISLAVAKSKRIVVVTGAGISCSSGIPDFRSSDGLYNLVKQKYPDVVLKGRDLFDASLFRDPVSTSVFYAFISQLKRSIDGAVPSPTHKFIKTLDSKKRLLRSYTQNIDGLEDRLGLISTSNEAARITSKGKTKIRNREVRNVQLHGDIHRVRCTFCSKEYPCTSQYLDIFGNGESPDCPECTIRSEARVARSARALKIGNLRPAIVLYDEPHPLGDDIGAIQSLDVNKKPDMLIVMGTSLKVHGLKKLVKDFAKAVHASSKPVGRTLRRTDEKVTLKPAKAGSSKLAVKASPKNAKNLLNSLAGRVVFVNRTPPSSDWDGIIDYWIEGECDEWAARVEEEWKSMRPSDWEVQQTLDGPAGFAAAKVAGATTTGTKGASSKGAAPLADSRRAGRENIPVTSPPSTPSSPSKRRKRASHYPSDDADTDIECSPSKRAVKRGNEILTPTTAMTMKVKKLALEGDQSMHMPERRKLFGDLLNDEGGRHIDLGDSDSSLTEDDEEDADVPLRFSKASTKRKSKEASATMPALGKTRSRGRIGTGLKMEVLIDSSKPRH